MSRRNKPMRTRAISDSVRRCALVASVQVTELLSGAVLSARISELAIGGCYVDALNPFPEGTPVSVRIVRDQGAFETKAKVAYCDSSFGMGLAFTEMAPDQRSLLETWIAESLASSGRLVDSAPLVKIFPSDFDPLTRSSEANA